MSGRRETNDHVIRCGLSTLDVDYIGAAASAAELNTLAASAAELNTLAVGGGPGGQKNQQKFIKQIESIFDAILAPFWVPFGSILGQFWDRISDRFSRCAFGYFSQIWRSILHKFWPPKPLPGTPRREKDDPRF